MIVTSPLKNYSSVYNPKLSLIKNKAMNYDELIKSLSLTNYVGIELSDSMLVFDASTIPQCDFLGLAIIIPFVDGSVLANCGLVFTTDELVSSLPSHNKVKVMVADKVVETMLLTQNSICKNYHVFISADKGNKKGKKNLAKFICWYDIDDCEVKTFLLGVDCTDEDTNEVAGALEHSLR